MDCIIKYKNLYTYLLNDGFILFNTDYYFIYDNTLFCIELEKNFIEVINNFDIDIKDIEIKLPKYHHISYKNNLINNLISYEYYTSRAKYYLVKKNNNYFFLLVTDRKINVIRNHRFYYSKLSKTLCKDYNVINKIKELGYKFL